MDIFDQTYFKINKFFMLCIGQWPYQPMYQRITISVVCNIMNSTIMFTMISGMLISKDFDAIVKIFTAIIISTMCASKINNSIINTKQLRLLLDQIKSDWMELSGPEVDILKKSAYTGRLLSLGYAVYVYATLGVYLITAFMPQILDLVKPLNETRLRRRTYDSNYYLDPEKYYDLISLHEHIATMINITILTAIDTMYVVFTQHICGMFGVLRYRLKNILKDNNDSWEILDENYKENQRITKEAIACISLHKKNIDYAKRLNSAFSKSIFFQIGLSMVLLSITGYVTISKIGVLDEFMQFFPYTISQVIYIFYNCLPGQKLIDASEHILISVYNAKWYKMPLKTQHHLKLLMLRSSRPCTLQAAGALILSLKTFSSCIQTSFSYFTVLLSMQK